MADNFFKMFAVSLSIKNNLIISCHRSLNYVRIQNLYFHKIMGV